MGDSPKVGFFGDIHGDFRTVRFKIAEHSLENMTLIQVGDFGFSFAMGHKIQTEDKYAKSLAEFNKSLKVRNLVMYAIRGNHDNPAYFDGRFILSNLKLLPDYTVLDINGQRTLFVGGAISLDRSSREEGKTYWKGEGFNWKPELVKDLTGIDMVVTHNAPTSAIKYTDSLRRTDLSHCSRYDQSLVTDVLFEQDQIQEMIDLLKQKNNIKQWYHGHFHYHLYNVIDGTAVRCCEIDSLVFHNPKI